jgi:Tol biopolymer transport system component
MKRLLIPLVIALLMSSGASAASITAGPPDLFDLGDYRVMSLSPDGSLIAAQDRKTLCTFDAATREEVACADVSELDAGLREEDMAWSPDSSKIAFAENAFRYFRDGDIWVMDAHTGELTDLTDEGIRGKLPILSSDNSDITEFFLDVNPAWSPDGETIAFSRTIWRNGEWRGNAISTVPAAGGEVTNLLMVNLALPGAVYAGIRWQADGEKIYFNYSDVDLDQPENGIWVIGADGSNPRQLLGPDPEAGPPVALQVSPDGTSILVYYLMLAAQTGTSGDVFALLNTETGDLVTIAPSAENASPKPVAGMVTMSPDGTTLLVVNAIVQPGQLSAYDIASREYTDLQTTVDGALSPAIGVMPSWAENGTVLLNVDLTGGALIELSGT